MSLDFQPIPDVSPERLRLLWKHVKQVGECWVWTGAVRNTYPLCGWEAGTFSAHRVFFTIFKGPIPDGMTLDHSCRNRLCVNPDHLFPMTQGDNARKALKLNFCKRGHAMEGDNIYLYLGGTKRRCKACIPIQTKAWRDRVAQKQAARPL